MAGHSVTRSMQFHWFLVLLALTVPSVVGQSMDTRRLAQEVLPAVVEIRIVGDSGGSSGSGFIVSPEGKIVTSLHVIAGATTGSVRLATGEVYDSFAVLSFDLRRDLAIIQIPGFDLPVVKLGNSNDAQPGDPVAVFGSPQRLQGSMTTGIVSGIRTLEAGFKVLQTDAAVNPGNSGGPLTNTSGEAIGIVDFKLKDSENLNFAIPVNYARGMLGNSANPVTLAEFRLLLGESERARASSLEEAPAPEDPVELLLTAKTISVEQSVGNPELVAAVRKNLIKWNRYTLVAQKGISSWSSRRLTHPISGQARERRPRRS